MDKTARDAQCREPTRKTMQSWKAGYQETGQSDLVGGSQKPDLGTGEGAGSPPNVMYVATQQGWLYLAVVLDLFSRAIVGWSMAAVQDERLVADGLRMALLHREPGSGLLHHSDWGSQSTSQSTSQSYQQLLGARGIQVSMSRRGNCYDNGVMERFWATLKGECFSRYIFLTHDHACAVIFEYIQCFYNRVCRHSTLEYLSPLQFEVLRS